MVDATSGESPAPISIVGLSATRVSKRAPRVQPRHLGQHYAVLRDDRRLQADVVLIMLGTHDAWPDAPPRQPTRARLGLLVANAKSASESRRVVGLLPAILTSPGDQQSVVNCQAAMRWDTRTSE